MFETPSCAPQSESRDTEPQAQDAMSLPRRKLPAILWIAIAGSVLLAAVAGISTLNYLVVDRPLQRVLSEDSRNGSIKASAHWGSWCDSSTLVFNVTDVSGASRIDVFRTLLEYADAMQNKQYSRVILAARGRAKFQIDGEYFQELGKEYDFQNPMYTIRTFPAHVATMDGDHPFQEYEGGIFAVLTAEMEQFTRFSDEWYANQ